MRRNRAELRLLVRTDFFFVATGDFPWDLAVAALVLSEA
jgi:hypothetical protein